MTTATPTAPVTYRQPCTCGPTLPDPSLNKECPACRSWRQRHPHKAATERRPDLDAPPARPGRAIQSREDVLARLLIAEKQLINRRTRGETRAQLNSLRRRIARYHNRLALLAAQEGHITHAQ